MSNLSLLLYTFLMVGLLSTFWKWGKALLVVILMEAITVLIMASFFMEKSGFTGLLLIMFSFFVSEALILLASLYGSLRVKGSIQSVIFT